MSYLSLLPGMLFLNYLRTALNILPTPALGTYPYLLEGLPYALEVMTHIKKPEVSL